MSNNNKRYRPVWDDVPEADLSKFARWYVNWFRRDNSPIRIVSVCMGGYFHLPSIFVDKLIRRCIDIGLMSYDKQDGTIKFHPPMVSNTLKI